MRTLSTMALVGGVYLVAAGVSHSLWVSACGGALLGLYNALRDNS